MRKTGCRHCMCPEVEPCRFRPAELFLLMVLRRPALCLHCRRRQYVFPPLLKRLFVRPPETALRYRR